MFDFIASYELPKLNIELNKQITKLKHAIRLLKIIKLIIIKKSIIKNLPTKFQDPMDSLNNLLKEQ